MEITTKVKLRVPKVPNFIMCEVGDGKVSVADLTDEQLSQIGEAWTARLMERAAEVRQSRESH